ncbi:MAG: hypothetical protein DMD75_09130 [Candidatus Rokuibacteriota bacterium]|nr:MAG: hypothetical protein DMD75_09130 [Candidatus Rokubacteria bacterium]
MIEHRYWITWSARNSSEWGTVVPAMVESIRSRLLRAPDRAGALRYVHFVLGAWNGEPLRDAGISTKRQAQYQRRMSSLL